MLNSNCLVRPTRPTRSTRPVRSGYDVIKTQGGWKIQYQDWETTWVILLSNRAYKAWKAGDSVFDSWGKPNTRWETEVEVLFFEQNEDN